MTFEYAIDRSEKICKIRANYSGQFTVLDQGDEVVCPNGEVGVITTMLYNPRIDGYFIVVSYRATGFTTTDPNCLSLVKTRNQRYVGQLT